MNFNEFWKYVETLQNPILKILYEVLRFSEIFSEEFLPQKILWKYTSVDTRGRYLSCTCSL